MRRVVFSLCLFALLAPSSVRGGLYYSAEQYAALPAQWRGFLLDHRALRNLALKPKNEAEASPLRTRYRQEAAKLEARLKKAKLSPDELADLGAIYIRLGEIDRAIEILQPSQRAHPNHFALAANLGAAWQMKGDLRQAEAMLEEAVRLAPGKLQAFEKAHLKLVRSRQRNPASQLDDLFGVRYVGVKNAFEPGKIAPPELKKLPARAVPIAQQLALWFPADGRLLWQLAELANAHGDVKTAAAMMEGCVVQFGMNHPTLRTRRQILREIVEKGPQAKLGVGQEHKEKHTGTIAFRSRRPLVSKLDTLPLPAIDPKGINPIPWELFAETSLTRPFKVNFPKYLHDLENKQISLAGFMYPLREDPDMAAFLFIEAPVGCWYCEMPETTGIVFIEMPAGQTTRYQRGLVRVIGQLKLNATDPEDFLYTVKGARVAALD